MKSVLNGSNNKQRYSFQIDFMNSNYRLYYSANNNSQYQNITIAPVELDTWKHLAISLANSELNIL